MRVLGISAFHRDSAAALVVDGHVVAAAQEERFTRLAGDRAFPTRAIRAVLMEGGVPAPELDHVVFYEKPLRKFERVLVNNLRAFPRSAKSFSQGLFLWLGDRIWIKNRIATDIGIAPEKVLFAEQLLATAAGAFLTSPAEEAALLVVDDAGEWATTLLGRGEGTRVEQLAEVQHPHSLGLVASALTQFLGFIPGEDEGKVEMLAAWGEPRFTSQLDDLVRDDGGLFSVEQAPFRFGYDSDRLYENALVELLGPPRFPGEPLRYRSPDSRDADVAASLQVLLETRVLAIARELARRVPSPDLCFAGALSLNRTLVARLLRESPFERVHVPFASGKSGAAIGAALLADPRRDHGEDSLGSLAIHVAGDPGGRTIQTGELSDRLERGERIGLFEGPMEFGPRSLQNRLILADARGAQASRELLQACQHVEPFLTVRVAVPAEEAVRFFELPAGAETLAGRGQLLVPATDELRAAAPSALLPNGLAWPLLVEQARLPRLHGLVAEHGRRTGVPLLLASDFRLRGSPLVCSAVDAAEGFRRTTLSALVVDDRIYERDPDGDAA